MAHHELGRYDRSNGRTRSQRARRPVVQPASDRHLRAMKTCTPHPRAMGGGRPNEAPTNASMCRLARAAAVLVTLLVVPLATAGCFNPFRPQVGTAQAV